VAYIAGQSGPLQLGEAMAGDAGDTSDGFGVQARLLQLQFVEAM